MQDDSVESFVSLEVPSHASTARGIAPRSGVLNEASLSATRSNQSRPATSGEGTYGYPILPGAAIPAVQSQPALLHGQYSAPPSQQAEDFLGEYGSHSSPQDQYPLGTRYGSQQHLVPPPEGQLPWPQLPVVEEPLYPAQHVFPDTGHLRHNGHLDFEASNPQHHSPHEGNYALSLGLEGPFSQYHSIPDAQGEAQSAHAADCVGVPESNTQGNSIIPSSSVYSQDRPGLSPIEELNSNFSAQVINVTPSAGAPGIHPHTYAQTTLHGSLPRRVDATGMENHVERADHTMSAGSASFSGAGPAQQRYNRFVGGGQPRRFIGNSGGGFPASAIAPNLNYILGLDRIDDTASQQRLRTKHFPATVSGVHSAAHRAATSPFQPRSVPELGEQVLMPAPPKSIEVVPVAGNREVDFAPVAGTAARPFVSSSEGYPVPTGTVPQDVAGPSLPDVALNKFSVYADVSGGGATLRRLKYEDRHTAELNKILEVLKPPLTSKSAAAESDALMATNNDVGGGPVQASGRAATVPHAEAVLPNRTHSIGHMGASKMVNADAVGQQAALWRLFMAAQQPLAPPAPARALPGVASPSRTAFSRTISSAGLEDLSHQQQVNIQPRQPASTGVHDSLKEVLDPLQVRRASVKSTVPTAVINDDSAADARRVNYEDDEDTATYYPERLIIALRRIPDKVTVSAPLCLIAGNSTDSVANTEPENGREQEIGGTCRDSTKGEPQYAEYQELFYENDDLVYDLQEADVPLLRWQLEKNEFGLDVAEAFPDFIEKVVVADPGVPIDRMTKDSQVQGAICESLRQYLRTNHNIEPVFLAQFEDGAAARERYSEEVLAPLFHHRLPPVSTGFHQLDWEGYSALNKAFLEAITRADGGPFRSAETDWVLVFNYQLLLLPGLLRDHPRTRSSNIGFYLGTVFPSSELYRILPQREDLLRGVIAASFIGFHGFQYKRHFLTSCTRVLGVECAGDRVDPDAAVGGGAGARVVTVPRGINTAPWLTSLRNARTKMRIAELRRKFVGRKVLLSIDTLDYTKGIPNKMLAFERFLAEQPEWASRVVFFQICVPKGHSVAPDVTGIDPEALISKMDRREILSNVYQLVGSINANYGDILTQPVHFLLSSLTVEHLVSLYALADILVLTPLRESLSWTAYEFILCQSITNKGVLILSEFSGSAQSLGAAALCINPWDANALAQAIHYALNMTEEEKLERHSYAYDYVLNCDSRWWASNLMQEFRDAVIQLETERLTIPTALPLTDPILTDCYRRAKHRLLILGLRGTLVPTVYKGINTQFTLAARSRLPRTVEAALQVLSRASNTHVLVVSSSPVSVVQKALGHMRTITLMAENGHFVRPGIKHDAEDSTVLPTILSSGTLTGSPQTGTAPGSVSAGTVSETAARGPAGWMCAANELDLGWMEPLEESCRYFEERTPGSIVLRTATAIAFNYSNAQRDHGTNQARDLLIHLWGGPQSITSRTDIVVGHHCVEVRSGACNKANSVERWLQQTITDNNININEACVLCVANFLPRDEDVFVAVERVLSNAATASEVGRAPSGDVGSAVLAIDNTDSASKSAQENVTDRSNAEAQLITCTVGLKPSRADFYVSSSKQVEQLMTSLAAQAVLESPAEMQHLSAVRSSSVRSPINSPREGPIEANRTNKRPGVISGEKRRPTATNMVAQSLLGLSTEAAVIRQSPELQRALVYLAGLARDSSHSVLGSGSSREPGFQRNARRRRGGSPIVDGHLVLAAATGISPAGSHVSLGSVNSGLGTVLVTHPSEVENAPVQRQMSHTMDDRDRGNAELLTTTNRFTGPTALLALQQSLRCGTRDISTSTTEVWRSSTGSRLSSSKRGEESGLTPDLSMQQRTSECEYSSIDEDDFPSDVDDDEDDDIDDDEDDDEEEDSNNVPTTINPSALEEVLNTVPETTAMVSGA